MMQKNNTPNLLDVLGAHLSPQRVTQARDTIVAAGVAEVLGLGGARGQTTQAPAGQQGKRPSRRRAKTTSAGEATKVGGVPNVPSATDATATVRSKPKSTDRILELLADREDGLPCVLLVQRLTHAGDGPTWNNSTAYRSISKLKSEGLIEGIGDPDGRAEVIRLTSEGRASVSA